MKLKKRKLKFAAIFGVCWFALLVLLVDGSLKFQTLVDLFGSYALVEIALLYWLFYLQLQCTSLQKNEKLINRNLTNRFREKE